MFSDQAETARAGQTPFLFLFRNVKLIGIKFLHFFPLRRADGQVPDTDAMARGPLRQDYVVTAIVSQSAAQARPPVLNQL